MPELPWADALVLARLVVYPAGHGPAVDGIVDLVLGEEPHLVPPLLRVSVRVLGIVVIYQVRVADILVKIRVERRVCSKFGQGHCDDGVVGATWKGAVVTRGWILQVVV